MLEKHYRPEFARVLSALQCEIELPLQWKSAYFEEKGVLHTVPDERRRFARHRFRTKGVLEIETSLPAFERPPAKHAVLIRDISRSGVGFLHTEQLFPMERCRMWLPTNRTHITIYSCREFNASCFLIGAQFVESGEAPAS
ncbi:MAG: hypothetical protein ACE5KM_23455 [Planctomycetaceae bacterium]